MVCIDEKNGKENVYSGECGVEERKGPEIVGKVCLYYGQ